MPTRLPRVNVTVTEEQHGLLLEIAGLQGGSAAGILRQQLDAMTPLLRAAVPLLRKVAQETALTRSEATDLLAKPLQAIREAAAQAELIETDFVRGRASPRASSVRERARTGARSA